MAELKLADIKSFASLPVKTPSYDIDSMIAKTCAEPSWLHFGAGNIFRIFIAGLADDLLDRGS